MLPDWRGSNQWPADHQLDVHWIQSLYRLTEMTDQTAGWSEISEILLFLKNMTYDIRKGDFRVNANSKRSRSANRYTVWSGTLLYFIIFYNTQWFYTWTVTVLIRLRGCAGWSGPSLSAYAKRCIFTWHGLNISIIISITWSTVGPIKIFNKKGNIINLPLLTNMQ